MDNKAIRTTIAQTFLELAEGISSGSFKPAVTVAITGLGSEHGESNIMAAACEVAREGLKVAYIGTLTAPAGAAVQCHYAATEAEQFKIMDELLASKQVQGAVAMHYPFPIGVATVGRSIVPATGKKMFLATTTGTASTDRVEAMVLNAITGTACAKACGIAQPTVGLLNLDGTRQVEQILKSLQAAGYQLNFAESARSDGGAVMRGNDVLCGTADVMVADSLTGNVICKLLAAGQSGGNYETTGFGYGPGLGAGYDKLVLIISRASGTPLVANALRFAAELASGQVLEVVQKEIQAAQAAGLTKLLEARRSKENKAGQAPAAPVAKPAKEVVTEQIQGIDVMDLEDAVQLLWAEGIYAEDGMGCTGPVIRVSTANIARASALLNAKGYSGC